MVGGLAKNPLPLGYDITGSPESPDEYTRKAGIVRKGQTVEVEALNGVQEVEFPGVEKLEAFYTDGLRTLLHTTKYAKDMAIENAQIPRTR
jgi:saccharopine dehydrogenase-like NADP-dependent oxidoreductase